MAINPLCSQVQTQLWLQLMSTAKPIIGDRSESGHMLWCLVHISMGQLVQPCLLCWVFTNKGVCSRKVCKYRHEWPLCETVNAFSVCNKRKPKSKSKKALGTTVLKCKEKGPSLLKLNKLWKVHKQYPRWSDDLYLLGIWSSQHLIWSWMP